MNKQDGSAPDRQNDEALREEKSPLRKDLFAVRTRLYDRIRIPLRTLDIIIYVLVGALILAILLGIGSNR